MVVLNSLESGGNNLKTRIYFIYSLMGGCDFYNTCDLLQSAGSEKKHTSHPYLKREHSALLDDRPFKKTPCKLKDGTELRVGINNIKG